MPILTTAHIARPATASSPLTGFLTAGTELLAQEDPQLHGAVCTEHAGQESTLSLLAGTGVVDPSVLACMAGVARPAEQLTGSARTTIELLARARAAERFDAGYANVLPHSLTAALAGVLDALTSPGDRVLDLRGDPLPGSACTLVEHTTTGLAQADADAVTELAGRTAPAVVVCGGEQAPAAIDYARLRAVADAVGALLVADVSGTAGQVAAGTAPSPVRHAHVTVACTHTQLFGPRGAVVLTAEPDRHAEAIAATMTWSWPGATTLPAVAGKARALQLAAAEQFRDTIRQCVAAAALLADELTALGHPARHAELGNHVVWLDRDTNPVAALREVGITVSAGPARLGTATLAQRRFGPSEVRQVAELLDSVFGAVRSDDTGTTGVVDEFVRLSAFDSVRRLLSQFPLPCYVPVTQWENRL